MSELRGYGFIAYAVERFFFGLQLASGKVIPIPPEFSRSHAHADHEVQETVTKKGAVRIDCYILLWLATEVALLVLLEATSLGGSRVYRILATVLCAGRILDIVQVGVNMSLFNQLRLRSSYYIGSVVRSIVLTIVNYFELSWCFGLIYAANIAHLRGAGRWTDAFYFSVITQLTIGYGDILPMHVLKIVAPLQGTIGLLFAIIIVTRFMSMLPNVKTVLEDSASQISPASGHL